MEKTEVGKILNFLGEKIQEQGFHLKINSNVFFEIVNLRSKEYRNFKEEIKNAWYHFKGKRNLEPRKRTYTHFLYFNFNDYFNYFLKEFFGLNQNDSLNLISKEEISDKNLIFEYSYDISEIEQKNFKELSQKLKNTVYNLSFPTAYIFFIVAILGISIRKTINEDLYISLEGANLYNNNLNENSMNFLVNIKDSKEELYNNYFQMVTYYFLKQFKSIPEENYKNYLEGRERLYNYAIKEYEEINVKDKLVDLLYYFYKKCNLLNNIAPILDFFNFVCSRVEDSIFSKQEIIKNNFLLNIDDYSTEKKTILLDLFTYLDRMSTLSGTFLANNLPSVKSQFNLFLLYKKYYFGSSLETLEVGDVLFLPEIFKKELNSHNRSDQLVIDSKSIRNIATFLDYFAILGNIKSIDVFFHKIFDKTLSELNYNFFITFFKSLNYKFFSLIDNFRKKLPRNEKEAFDFKFVTENICRMLYVLIDKTFLRKTPEEASKNFHDPRGRYVPKNIALRVLEMFIFQDINFSDDLWSDYILSWNQEKVLTKMADYIEDKEQYFYSVKDLTRFLITYNFQTFKEEIFLEEWLINSIIIPLNKFIFNIRNKVKDSSNSIHVYEQLVDFMLDGINDEEKVGEIKFVCEKLADFWSII